MPLLKLHSEQNFKKKNIYSKDFFMFSLYEVQYFHCTLFYQYLYEYIKFLFHPY
jgi:hypothetical protein